MSPDDAMQARYDQYDDALRGGMCLRCQGTGEIVTDWERYWHAQEHDVGDEGTDECPDCDGTGSINPETGLSTAHPTPGDSPCKS